MFRREIIVFLVLLLLPAPVYSKNIYVPRDYKKIQSAIDAAEISDTIWIAKGHYVETLNVHKEVIIFGAGADKCSISPPSNSFNPVIYIKKNDTIIDGLTVDAKNTQACVVIDGGSPSVSRMIIKNSVNFGILVKGEEKNTIPIIKENKILKNKKVGLLVLGTDALIKNNEVYSNGSTGISCKDSSARIDGNKVYENQGAGIVIKKKVVFRQKVEKHVQVVNNIVTLNKEGGIVCEKASPIVRGNTVIVKSGKPNIMLFSSNAVIENNKLESSGPPAVMIMAGSFPKIISNEIKGTLRFPIMGNKENALIKNNKITSMWKSRTDFLSQ